MESEKKMDDLKWNIKKTEYAKLGRFETVYETLESEDGGEHYYSFVRFSKIGVCVLPLLDNGEIMMIKQYRRPFDRWLYELPAGTVDDGEEPEETAERELKEETGCIAEKVIPCGYIYPSPGSTDEIIHLFIAHCHTTNRRVLDESETIINEPLSESKICSMLENNLIHHSAAIILLQKHILNKINTKAEDKI